jgi:hypothetical protein
MPSYVLAYTGGGMPETDDERRAELAAWGEWYGRLGAAVVDGGNPFGPSATVGPDGAVTRPGRSGLTGYSIVSADDLDGALTHAESCPILRSGGSVEVYETFAVG